MLETGAAFTDFFVDVSLSSPASQALLFDASLISLTGTVGTDIELLNSQVAFRPGETTAAVKVRVFGDTDETEGVETVELELTPATGIPFVGSIPNTLITIGDGVRPTFPSNASDVIFGTPGDDVIDLRAGNDDYRGLAGDDEIEPGLGNDTVDGGFGDDTVTYEDALGAVQVFLNLGFSRGADGRDALSNVEGIIGSAFGDRLTGDANANVLNGLAGDDILKGKGGLDSYFGGNGDDRISGDNQADTMFGEADDDQLSGLSGSDYMDGGIGNDSLFGGRDSDTMIGGDGDDRIRGNRGGDDIDGGDGLDNLRGGGGNDTIDGGAGIDEIFGENGADRIISGAGNDKLWGGSGGGVFDGTRDVFVFESGSDFDQIKDWEDGTDQLDLSSYGFSNFTADVFDAATDRPSGLRIDLGGGDIIFVENFLKADFDSGDVIL